MMTIAAMEFEVVAMRLRVAVLDIKVATEYSDIKTCK